MNDEGWLMTQPKGNKDRPPYRLIFPNEVAKHNTEDDLWVTIDGIVYDLTEFTVMHPGGIASIVVNAGRDVTDLFNSIHGAEAKQWMRRFSIGILAEEGEGEGKAIMGISRPVKWALQPRKWIDVELVSRVPISPDSYRFKFELCNKSKKLGLPIGQHVLLEGHIGGGHLVIRPYTPVVPISDDDDQGIVEMVIKIYRAGANPIFNHGGVLTQYLEKIDIGTKLHMKGPEGYIHYHGRGIIAINEHPLRVRRISMIAGGSGITPMYQLIKAILNDKGDQTELMLLYANHTVEDILLKVELDQTAAKSKGQFKVWYAVSVVPKGLSEWKFSVGRITLDMMKEHLFPPANGSIVLLCGPPAMVTHTALPSLEKLGYQDEQVFEF
jgi:nitrate reductase (NAD(P)H)